MALVRIVTLALTLATDPKVAGGGCVFVPHVFSRAPPVAHTSASQKTAGN